MADDPLDKDDSVDVGDWYEDLTYKEVHLFVEGFYRGVRNLDPRFSRKLQGTVLGDSWYAKGGYVLGTLLHVVLVYVVGVSAGVF
jgi:hypothetical protein